MFRKAFLGMTKYIWISPEHPRVDSMVRVMLNIVYIVKVFRTYKAG